jgi:hypothetical protein
MQWQTKWYIKLSKIDKSAFANNLFCNFKQCYSSTIFKNFVLCFELTRDGSRDFCQWGQNIYDKYLLNKLISNKIILLFWRKK